MTIPSQPDLREAVVAEARIVLSNWNRVGAMNDGYRSLHAAIAALDSQLLAKVESSAASQPAPAAPEKPWREASRRLHEAGDDTDDGLVPTHARRPGDSLDDVEEASPDRLSGSNRSHPSQPTPSQPDLREALELLAVALPRSGHDYPHRKAKCPGCKWKARVAALASQPAPAAIRVTACGHRCDFTEDEHDGVIVRHRWVAPAAVREPEELQ